MIRKFSFFFCLLNVLNGLFFETKEAFAQNALQTVSAQEKEKKAQQEAFTPKSVSQIIPDVHVGRSDAPIKIIEYSSLTCHHCAQFHKNVLPALMEKYITTGKVQLVFRHFPIDEYALKAATVVASAAPLRQFALINKLFETQEQWTGDHCLAALARLSGETPDTCRQIIDNKVLSDQVLMTRFQAEREMKIDGTPTFMINGRVIDYAPTLTELEALIKPQLEAISS